MEFWIFVSLVMVAVVLDEVAEKKVPGYTENQYCDY